MSAYVVDVPGALHSYLSGTGAVQGDLYSDNPDEERGARELRSAYSSSRQIRRGRGYSLRLVLPSIDAVAVLASYAHWCISSNYGGDVDHSEVAAARAVLARCQAVAPDRLAADEWSVTLDGVKVT